MADTVSVKMSSAEAEEILECLENRAHWYRYRGRDVPARTRNAIARMHTVVAAIGALGIAAARKEHDHG